MSVATPPRPTTGTAGRQRTARASAWVAVAAVLAGMAVSPPWRVGTGVPEGSAGRFVAGDLERLDGGRWVAAVPGELLDDGVSLRSGDGAEIEVRGGELELGEDTRVVLDDPVVVDAGSLLTDVAGREREVRAGDLLASGRGTWRTDVAAGVRVAVYRGGAGVEVAGSGERGLAVSRFEQVATASPQLPAAPLPMAYSGGDEWDVRLLSGLLATDRVAAQLARSFAARYGSEPLPRSFYTRFTAVDEAIDAALGRLAGSDGDRFGPPGDVLVAVVVTDLLADRAGLTTEEAATEAVALRAAGATWGIVLARHDLSADDLRGAVDLAVRGAPAPTVDGPATGPGDAAVPTAGTTGGAPGPTDGPTDGPTEGPTTDPTPTPSPSPTEEPAAGPCQLEPCEPVNETVDELTDVIDGVVPGAGQTVDDLVSEVPTILPSDGLP